jgi:hypothetical protein
MAVGVCDWYSTPFFLSKHLLTTNTVGLMGIPVAAFGFVSHAGYSAVRTQSNALAVHIPRPTGVDERKVSQC